MEKSRITNLIKYGAYCIAETNSKGYSRFIRNIDEWNKWVKPKLSFKGIRSIRGDNFGNERN